MRLLPAAALLTVTVALFGPVASSSDAAAGRVSARHVCPAPAAALAACDSQVVTDAAGAPQVDPLPYGYGPVQFQTAYGLTAAAASPTTQTIALVDAYDDPTAEGDLGLYASTYGLPPCSSANGCFRKVDQRGGNRYPRADERWALEISLDLQVAHAVCPNCHLLLVEASSDRLASLMTAEDYAVSQADVVSNSWGGGEISRERNSDAHFDHPGVPITVSSGDFGYGVQWPAASPFVTAVGGTTLTLAADNTRSDETVWSGAGSGCSAYEPKPAWQADGGCPKRTVADVSADADPATGAAVYDSYGYQGASGWFTVGGTSLSAPLVAAVYALAGNGASTLYGSFPYAHSSAFFDVTFGTNGWWCGNYLCTAGPGYDGPTGLGTPNGPSGF